MTDKERIAQLEARVAYLESMKNNKTPWRELSEDIDYKLAEIFLDDKWSAGHTKSAITSLLNKAFFKRTVLTMSEQECKDAKLLVNFIIEFLSSKREQYKENITKIV